MATTTSSTEIIPAEGTVGATLREQFHFAAGRRVGDVVELSGQTGHSADLSLPEGVAEQVANAFGNARAVLDAAELGWDSVFAIRTYHVVPASADSIPGDAIAAVLQEMSSTMPDQRPIWTAIAVQALAFPGMHIEVEFKALA